MKRLIEVAEKVLLFVLPYALLVSLSYYWGYWGFLDIDAISYYGVQDLIKGFAFTSPFAVLTGIAIVLVIPILDWYLNLFKTNFFLALSIGLVVIGAEYYRGARPFAEPETSGRDEDFVVSAMTIVGFSLSYIVTTYARHKGWLKDDNLKDKVFKHGIQVLLILPICAFCLGRIYAKQVVSNEIFTYARVPNAVILPQIGQATLKYLGKAGDSHFFLSLNNKERHIISAQTLPSLVLYKYDKYDSTSTRAYKSFLRP